MGLEDFLQTPETKNSSSSTGLMNFINNKPSQQPTGLFDIATKSFKYGVGRLLSDDDKALAMSGKPSYISEDEWLNNSVGDTRRGVWQYGEKLKKENEIQTAPWTKEWAVQGIAGMIPEALGLAVAGSAAMRGSPNALAARSSAFNTALGATGRTGLANIAGEAAASASIAPFQALPEAELEANEAYNQAIKDGKSQQEASSIKDQVRTSNLGMLSVSDTAQNLLSLGKIPLPGGAIAKNAARLGRFGLSAGFEGVEEGAQDIIPKSATGKDWSITDDSTLESVALGALAGGVFHGAGRGVNFVADRISEKGLKGFLSSSSPVDSQSEKQNELNSNAPTNTVDQIISAISAQESGGNSNAVNTDSGAYGEFQIMPENLPAWANEAGVSLDEARTPEGQRKVARFKFNQYLNQFGSPELVAAAWYAGPAYAQSLKDGKPLYDPNSRFNEEGMIDPNGKYPSVNEYIQQVTGRMKGVKAVPVSSTGFTEALNSKSLDIDQLKAIRDWAEEKRDTDQNISMEDVNFIDDSIANGKSGIYQIAQKYPVEVLNVLKGKSTTETPNTVKENQNNQEGNDAQPKQLNMQDAHWFNANGYLNRKTLMPSSLQKSVSSMSDDLLLSLADKLLDKSALKGQLDVATTELVNRGILPLAVNQGVAVDREMLSIARDQLAVSAARQQADDMSVRRLAQIPNPEKSQSIKSSLEDLQRLAQLAGSEQSNLILPNQQNQVGIETVADLARQDTLVQRKLPTAEEANLQRQMGRAVLNQDYPRAIEIARQLGLDKNVQLYESALNSQSSRPRERMSMDDIRRSSYYDKLTDVEKLFVDLVNYYDTPIIAVEQELSGEYNEIIKDYTAVLRRQMKQGVQKKSMSPALDGQNTPTGEYIFQPGYSRNYQWYQNLLASFNGRKPNNEELATALNETALGHLRNGYVDQQYGEQVPESEAQKFNDLEAAINGIQTVRKKIEPALPYQLRGDERSGAADSRTVQERKTSAIAIGKELGKKQLDILQDIHQNKPTLRQAVDKHGKQEVTDLSKGGYVSAPGGKVEITDKGQQAIASQKEDVQISSGQLPDIEQNHEKPAVEQQKRDMKVDALPPYEIIKTKHTKTDQDIWVVRPNGRLTEAEFSRMKAEMKRIGGSQYSRFTKGFNFYQDPSKKLAINQPSDSEGSQVESKPESNKASEQVKETSEVAIAYGSSVQNLADWVKQRLSQGKRFISQDLFAEAIKAFKGTQAAGKYTPKDAYDAMELGVNQYLLSAPYADPSKADTANKAAEVIERIKNDILEKIPTQTKRTAEQDEFQQFSTPPTLAYTAAWVSGVKASDTILEPSAGIGGLAVFAKLAGAKTIVNEYSSRRADILKLMGMDQVYTENAEQIDNILPDTVKPTLVIMNPPFSSTAGRMQDKRDTKNAVSHIEQALNRLEHNGRLVAIVGNGMADNAPAFSSWWKKIKSEYNVRANVGIDGSNYAKYGTTFDNNLFVIDKNGPTPENGTITGIYKNLADVVTALEGVHSDRQPANETDTEAQPTASKPIGEAVSGASRGEDQQVRGNGSSESLQTDGLGVRERENTTRDAGTDQQSSGNRSENRVSEDNSAGQSNKSHSVQSRNRGERLNSNNQQSKGVKGSGTGGVDIAGSTANVDRQSTGGQPPSTERNITIEKVDTKLDKEKPLTNSTFDEYTPQRLKISGAKQHPSPLVQSAAMAAVKPPEATYSPRLPKEIITQGKLSIAQIEPIVYAGQSFEQTLPDGTRKGYFIGDGTGVGKGREISGIILDSLNAGKKKAVWISKNDPLFDDAIRDWTDIGGKEEQLFPLNKTKLGDEITRDSGVLFVTYPTLAFGMETTARGDVKTKVGKSSRLDQIVSWLGQDFDGVIAFDEAHMMANSVPVQGSRGIKKASVRGLTGVELQKLLPNASIVYVSATGATEVENLAYAARLGLWGEGTPFANVNDFITQIKSAGLAAMELVARDMKALGVYLARNLSFDGVTYGTLTHELTNDQRKIYDTMATGWQVVLQNIHEALKETGVVDSQGKTVNANAKKNAMGQFWGAQQRFFNQILTSMQMPAVIDDVKKQIQEGNAVVMQLVNTNEATQNRALSNMEEDASLEDLDMTPRDILMQYIDKSFPTQQHEEYMDETGNKRSRPVVDSKGTPVINRQALRMKESLLDKLGSMKVPEGPLEMVINTFGTKQVAEVTGRQRRVVRETDDTGRTTSKIEKRSKAHNKADVKAFIEDKKSILIFSEAGGTGQSFHAGANMKNKRRRIHYLIQPGWRADSAVQGFGRTHRSGEVSQPHYVLVTTNLKGQKRFISTIARRLDQLGALTKGQRDAANQGLFSAKDNLESDYARDALQRFYENLMHNAYLDLNAKQLLTKMGLDSLAESEDKSNKRSVNADVIRDVPKFLNRLLTLDAAEQNKVFDYFSDNLDQIIDSHIANGTLDTGMETLRADGVKIKDEKVVYTDSKSGAETSYIELEVSKKNKLFSFAQAQRMKSFLGIYKNKKSGKVWAIRNGASRTNATGSVVDTFVLQSPSSERYRIIDESEFKRDGWKKVADNQAEEIWQQAMAGEPKYNTETVHMITGAILPIWDRLPPGQARVLRVQTDDGRVLLGRIIKDRDVSTTLKRLGTSKEQNFTSTEIKDKILADNNVVELSNGWKLAKRRVSGENRIEILGEDLWKYNDQFDKHGIIRERIDWTTRYFLPISEAFEKSYEWLTKDRQVTDVIPSESSSAIYFGFDPTFGKFNDVELVAEIKKMASNIGQVMPGLIELGRRTAASGYIKSSDWAKKMRDLLGDSWTDFKSRIADVWREVKPFIENERGSVTFGNEKNVSDLAKGFKTDSGKALTEADRKEFIVKPDGSIDFGEITQEIADKSNGIVTPAKIRLQVGFDQNGRGYGLVHIKKRESQLKKLGYSSAEQFVSDIAQNFDLIYDEQKDKRIILVKRGEQYGSMPVDLELVPGKGNEFYTVVTAVPIGSRRLAYINKKPLLFDRGASPSLQSDMEVASGLSPQNVGGEAHSANDKSSGSINYNIRQNKDLFNSNDSEVAKVNTNANIVTLDQLKKRFPNFKFEQSDKGFLATTPANKFVEFRIDADIPVDYETIRKAYGKEIADAVERGDALPLGRTQPMVMESQFGDVPWGAVVELAKVADLGVVDHETIHVVKGLGLVTDGAWGALKRRYDPNGKMNEEQLEEAVAEGYRKWNSSPHKIFSRLKKFFEDLYLTFANPDVRKIYKSIQDGSIFNRKSEVERRSISAILGPSYSAERSRWSIKTKEERKLDRRQIIEAIEALGTKVRFGRLDSDMAGVYKDVENIIRTRKAYDWDAILPLVGQIVDKKLELSKAGLLKQGDVADFVSKWILDDVGAITEYPAIAKVFDSKMAKNADFADNLRTLKGVLEEWNNQDAWEYAKGVISQDNIKKWSWGALKDKVNEVWKNIYRQFFESNAALNDLVRDIEKSTGEKVSLASNPYIQSRLYRGRYGKAITMIEGNQEAITALERIYPLIDFKNFKTLRMILDEVGATKNKDVFDKFNSFVIAMHTKDIHEHNKEQAADNPEYKPMTTVLSEDQADAIIKSAPEVFRQAQKDIVNFSNTTLEILYQSGVISKERFFEVKNAWKNYVPMFRVFEDNEMKSFGDSLKEMVGSNRDVINPMESIIANTFKMIDRAEKNKVKRKVAAMARIPGVGEFIEEVDGKNYDDDTTFTVRINGKTKRFQTTPDIVYAINNMSDRSSSLFWKIFYYPTQIARATVTIMNPEFALRNVFRDVEAASIYAKYGFTPKDFLGGFMSAIRKDSLFWEYMSSGAAQADWVALDRNYTNSTLRKMMSTPAYKKLIKIGTYKDMLQASAEYSEYGTRIGTYKKAKESGATILEAALESRDLMDFARGGKSSRDWNKLSMFSNVVLQSWDKFFRTFDMTTKEGRKRAAIASVRIGAFLLLPTLLLWLRNKDDDRYKQLPQWQKDTHWIILTDEHIFRIPKTEILGTLICSLMERSLNWMYNKDAKSMKNVENLLSNQFPSLLPTTLLPFIETVSNHSFFTGNPIVPQYQEKLPDKLQSGPYTSGAAKYLGEKLDLSPRKIDHLLFGYTGNLGRALSNTADIVTGQRNMNTQLEELPFVRGVMISPFKNPQVVTDFYDTLDEQTKLRNEAKTTGKVPSDYNNSLYTRLNTANERMSLINKKERMLLNDKSMDDDGRKQALETLNMQRMKLAKMALGQK